MKKFFLYLMAFAMLFAFAGTAFAAEVQPGDTVTVTFTIEENKTLVAGAVVKYDAALLEYVGVELGIAVDFSDNMFTVSGGQGGTLGKVTFKVKDAAAGKTVYVTASAEGADFNAVVYNPQVTVSGGTIKVAAPACQHTYETTEKKATCETAGEKVYTCTQCGDTKTEAIAALGHKWDNGAVTKEATCTAEGVKTYTCAQCGDTKTEAIAALGHKWDNGAVTKEATCTAEGVKTYTCAQCGDTATEKIAKKAHTEVVVAGKAATCTEKGLTDGKKCSVCGTVTVAQKEIAKKAHTEVVVAGKAATCTEKGLTDGKKCSVCGAVTVAQKEIAKKAHTEVVVAGKAATCTEKGLTDGKKCSACGAVTVAQKEIAAKGHTDGKWVTVKAATREEEGLKELHCADCNAVLKSETIPVVTVVYYWDNTACSMGLTFRDLTDLTDEWYQFTPVDLSIEGTQTFYLAASNMYVIGEVIVTVEEGNVTVECEYFSDDIKVKSEFCTFLPSLAETVTVNQEELTNYAFGEPISIEEALAGDTKVLLYICNVVDYNTDMPVVRFYADDTAVKKAIAAMQLVMD